jgi:hypothetical protein
MKSVVDSTAWGKLVTDTDLTLIQENPKGATADTTPCLPHFLSNFDYDLLCMAE